MKGLAIFGSTGSIGRQTCDVVRAAPRDFRVVALSGHLNLPLLIQQSREFKPAIIVVGDTAAAQKLATKTNAEILVGDAGFARAAKLKSVEMVVSAVAGVAGLSPTLAAIRAGKKLALANKESLVLAGDVVMRLARKNRVSIFPVDSEHAGVWQLLPRLTRGWSPTGVDISTVRRVILTASGGALREWPLTKLRSATPRDVLRHPTWAMGAKITVDSATLANKAFEVIEAHHLFGLPYEKIEAVIHPQSLVHALVEFNDGSVVAQLAEPDMRLPIRHALYEGKRQKAKGRGTREFEIDRLDLCKTPLAFAPIDHRRYPIFQTILAAASRGGLSAAVAATASEVASERFLAGEIRFDEIASVTARILKSYRPTGSVTIPRVLEVVAEVMEKLKH